MGIVVFLGPSLGSAEASGLLDAQFLPPAGQGDVYRVVRDLAPDAIGLIDGYFHQRASVWHREILYALSQGIPVFGGASMGALRAAELADFGMTGVGRIFEAYRAGVFPPYAGPFDSDDEVAVIHGPAELGFLALSDALVDLRAAYAAACDGGIISVERRDQFVAIAAAIPFARRSHEAVLAAAQVSGMPEPDRAALASWLEDHPASLKRNDARAVLGALDQWRRAGAPAHEPSFAFEEPSAWRAFVLGEERRIGHALSQAEEAVLDLARFEEPDWDELRRLALVRVSAASGRPPAVPVIEETRRAFDAWRRMRSLTSHAALESWMAAQGIDEAGLTRLFEGEARHQREAADCAAVRRAVIEELRLSGRFAALLVRAERQAALLATSPDAAREPSALEASFLLDATQGGRGLLLGRSVEAERVRLAFDTQAQLLHAAWRCHCTVAATLK